MSKKSRTLGRPRNEDPPKTLPLRLSVDVDDALRQLAPAAGGHGKLTAYALRRFVAQHDPAIPKPERLALPKCSGVLVPSPRDVQVSRSVPSSVVAQLQELADRSEVPVLTLAVDALHDLLRSRGYRLA